MKGDKVDTEALSRAEDGVAALAAIKQNLGKKKLDVSDIVDYNDKPISINLRPKTSTPPRPKGEAGLYDLKAETASFDEEYKPHTMLTPTHTKEGIIIADSRALIRMDGGNADNKSVAKDGTISQAEKADEGAKTIRSIIPTSDPIGKVSRQQITDAIETISSAGDYLKVDGVSYSMNVGGEPLRFNAANFARTLGAANKIGFTDLDVRRKGDLVSFSGKTMDGRAFDVVIPSIDQSKVNLSSK